METTVRRDSGSTQEPEEPRRRSRSQGFVSLGLAVTITSAVLVAVLGGGEVSNHVELQAGGAWLASTSSMVHVNGAAASADATIDLPGAKGNGLQIVERGPSVYAVDTSKHPPHWYKISSSTQKRAGDGVFERATSDLQIVTSERGTYIVDRAGTVRTMDSNGPGRVLHLAPPLGQAAADADGTVWVPNGNGEVIGIRNGHAQTPTHVAKKGAELAVISVGGRANVLDIKDSRIFSIDPLGHLGRPIAIGGLHGVIKVPEIIETGSVLFVVADFGDQASLVRVDLAGRLVSAPTSLFAKNPSAVEISDSKGYVVDRGHGLDGTRIFEVDLATGAARQLDTQSDPPLGPETSVAVQAGTVYVNDPATSQAFVIGSDGQPRTVDKTKVVPPIPNTEPPTSPVVPPTLGSPGSLPPNNPAVSSPSSAPPPPPGAKAPDAPIPITASPSGPKTLSLNWSAGNDNGAAITDFELRCSGTGAATGQATAAGGTNSIDVTPLDNQKSYVCTIRAINSAGASPAAAFPPTTVESKVPNAPAAPTAVPNDGTIDVTFQPLTAPELNGATIDGYRVGCTAPGGAGGTGTAINPKSQATITGLTNGKSYSCTVTPLKAGKPFGQPSPPSHAAVPFGRPSVITASATVSGDRTIAVSFGTSDNGSPITGCTINGGSAPCGGQTFGGLGYSTGYSYTIVAQNAAGQSAGVTVGATTNAPPPPPPPPPTVTISKGAPGTIPACTSSACAWVNVSLSNFAPGTYSGDCYSSLAAGSFFTFSIAAGQTKSPCMYGYPGRDVWVIVNGVESNHVRW